MLCCTHTHTPGLKNAGPSDRAVLTHSSTMKAQKGRRPMAAPRVSSHLMYVVAVVLCIQAQYHCDSSQDAQGESDYFYSLPVFNFGAYFYVGFPNDTLAE